MAKVKVEGKQVAENMDGWKDHGMGELPPFLHTDVGDVLQGRLINVKVMEQTEGKGKKKITREKIHLELELTAPATLSQGSTRRKTYKRVEVGTGKVIAFAIGGNLISLLKDAVFQKTGEAPSDDVDVDAEFLAPLKGVELRIERFEDGIISKGQWKGNPVKRYSLKSR